MTLPPASRAADAASRHGPQAGGLPDLRVGLVLGAPADGRSWFRLLSLAAWAETLGLDSLWFPEGHFRPGVTASPLVGLAAVASRTRRLRLGTTSLLISIHDPSRIAADVATLHLLSRGRVLLGVGRGFDTLTLRAFGVDPRSKRRRFDQALDRILAAWSGEAGRLDASRGAGEDGGSREPRPLQIPHPPILVAAFGRKGLLQAAQRGLPYLASPLESLETLAANYAFHRTRLPSGVDPVTLPVPVIRTVHVAASAAEARGVREAIAAEAGRLASVRSPAVARAALGALDQRTLVGEPSEVVEAIHRYREEIGMDLLVVRPPAVKDDGALRESLRRLVEGVLPRLQPVSAPPTRPRGTDRPR